jgi:hypothetical protein
MKTLRVISIYLLVLCTTFYVGIGVFQLICPFDQHFDTIEFAKYWKIVDGYMGKRMSIFMPIWLLVVVLNLIVFVKTWRRSPIFWIILSTLIILIIDISFTITHQIPINKFFQSIDVNNLTEAQIKLVQQYREATDKNFDERKIHVLIVFFLISLLPYLLPRLNKEQLKISKIES